MMLMADLRNDYILRRQQAINTLNQVETGSKNQPKVKPNVAFEDVLKQINEKDSVKFSKHAMNRLEERSIKLSQEEIGKINSAVNQADGKGIRDALILMDDKIFIANVKSRTIVTAAHEGSLKENIFTNIDGAVII